MPHTSAPPTPPPLSVRVDDDDGGHVLIDVTDAAVTRLVRLLADRPSLTWTLDRAAGRGPAEGPAVAALRRAAVAELAADRDVRAVCTARLSRAAATDLAAALIGAAASVGAGRDADPDPTSPSAERTPR
jgi:hypothetical protein